MVQQTDLMLGRRRLLPAIGRGLLTLPDRTAHGLIIRELDTWIRLEFLGLMVRSGVADAMAKPRTTAEIANQTDITDHDLLEAVLALGVSLRELREQHGRYSIRGRRIRAVAGRSADLRGVVAELIVYDNPIYTALESHLRGTPAQPYDADHGDVIAAASRVAEPVLGPTLRTVVADVRPSRVLDIGCGSGIYLRHVLEAAPTATGLGIDLDDGAVTGATAQLADLQGEGRCEVRRGDIETMSTELDQFDLVLLPNNIYYWPPEHRAEILRTVRGCIAPGGTLVLASATPRGQAFNRHLDVMLRVTSSSHRLPTTEEIEEDLRSAGFTEVSLVEPVPMSGLAVATARHP